MRQCQPSSAVGVGEVTYLTFSRGDGRLESVMCNLFDIIMHDLHVTSI